jgi:hypothetical protein
VLIFLLSKSNGEQPEHPRERWYGVPYSVELTPAQQVSSGAGPGLGETLTHVGE